MIPNWLEDYRLAHNRQPMTSRQEGDDSETNLLRDVAFNRHSMNDGHHVSPSDNGLIQIGADGIEVVLAQGIDVEQFRKTLTMATRATIGMDLTQTLPGDWEVCDALWEFGKTGQNWSLFKCDKHDEHQRDRGDIVLRSSHVGRVPYPDWEEMLKGGLQTALESQTIVFAVSGVSRTCTHQLVRSRRAAFHQQSQRASYMGDVPECRMPESVWRKPRARRAMLDLIVQSWKTYQTLCEEDISYQDSRFALLEGTTNFIMLEYTVREFLNLYAYRACSMFQWEIVHVMREAGQILAEEYPWLAPYIKISCEKTGPVEIPLTGGWMGPTPQRPQPDVLKLEHHCTFQGWEDVEGQCDFPWAKHEARTFKPEHHRISRKET